MATIIAASLQLQSKAEETVKQLISAGFASQKVTSFFINPPGQHALYPIGGDRYQSPGIDEDNSKDVTVNTAFVKITEAVIGVTHDDIPAQGTAPAEHATSHTNTAPLRRAGMLVAVEVTDKQYQDKAVALLKQLGAHNLEEAEGKIVDGEWIDFDPLIEPRYL